ncbi:hypothetical protein KAFR_0B04970 [Kazachstania africana CBS 2517]|uniref:RRM Nup35-type domain-containing protein n=1 Tax=Kazachstania africana (strain ATCC 22294 / BCRC 22015 / CBS 2517 / CECT 1963 / NBRC 1671 / NRRL Y-8276) TaxID=1071382 RepID=H2AQZ3_KAZAF|nr:hypothetical protein KAFR_0B04970 [Kazachstania africana CBS 2517]CCF56793.1 hypothetical protein KAFR_0B04970 [Kazachstania africana CBS 2517]
MNSNSSTGRFTNVSVLTQQQPSQQQTQQQNNVPSFHPQISAPQYNGFQSGLGQSTINQTQKDPSWFNNPRKRVIPQNIIKRSSTRQSSSNNQSQSADPNSNMSTESGFNSLTFGSKKAVPTSTVFGSSQNLKSLNSDNILGDATEAPPMVSIHDWKREDEFGSMPILSAHVDSNVTFNRQQEDFVKSTNSLPITQNASSTNLNIFDKSIFGTKESSNTLSGTGINGSDKGVTANNRTVATNSVKSTSTIDRNNNNAVEEVAVIVFGYPESISNMIITHFSHFGNILEDFEVLRSASGINVASIKNQQLNKKNSTTNDNKKYPIFTGDGWVKLTYDSQASALRALQDNGTIQGGSLIGCVPYAKATVEQLASCKIEKNDNIGENNLSSSNGITTSTLGDFPNDKTGHIFSEIDSNQNRVTVTSQQQPQQNALYSAFRLNIKDGKSLFVHNTNPSSHNFLQSLESKMRQQEENSNKQDKNGILHTVNNWLFGWNNL